MFDTKQSQTSKFSSILSTEHVDNRPGSIIAKYICHGHAYSYCNYGSHLYLVHVELALHIALIHCAIGGGCTPCAIDYSWGFRYGTLPCPITFEDTKLLAILISAAQWCKSHVHNLLQSKVIQGCRNQGGEGGLSPPF